MESMNQNKLHSFYKHQLLHHCISFWSKNMVDKENQGYFTCLDQKGKVYATDKSIWFQGRGLWMYSKLCNTYDANDEWLDIAKSGYDFLDRYGFDQDGRMFFSVTKEGKPLRKRRYMFSETFAAIGFAEYSKAAKSEEALHKARKVYQLLTSIYQDPKNDPYHVPPKYYPQTRPMKAMAVPMILLNTNAIMREHDPENKKTYDQLARTYINDILNDFYKPEHKALFETVLTDGSYIDDPMGRTLNPGHAIEASWFLMHEALYFKDDIIMKKALDILKWSLEAGWDQEYGGILSFIDAKGGQAQPLEWDMKLWWPQTETLYALLLAYQITQDEWYGTWYQKVHKYAFEYFPDKEHKEWYGYLHRDGSIANSNKGNLWKGPFHIPRAFLLCSELMKDDPVVLSQK